MLEYCSTFGVTARSGSSCAERAPFLPVDAQPISRSKAMLIAMFVFISTLRPANDQLEKRVWSGSITRVHLKADVGHS